MEHKTLDRRLAVDGWWLASACTDGTGCMYVCAVPNKKRERKQERKKEREERKNERRESQRAGMMQIESNQTHPIDRSITYPIECRGEKRESNNTSIPNATP
ncbi:uncharacterized protein BP01DRAFT_359036 [Aspergillus saccharolyticus JOP 1030-1]|uniref:Uncharacterized protein n=1 Tax=Aspergillus saccharolyticus JOP 1030-1 TaxID=1450539 RepID=A0A318Z696_9EURO|nr:hypothetical protein BP01DRAFT_359036 [Aspergillus saccharolyticus JOP 1030-1]PYH42805.1 hypothetical protein BP01DRAFT_359036 [Aspergillus saccharolyticus JOP 1030-1]